MDRTERVEIKLAEMISCGFMVYSLRIDLSLITG